MLSAVLLLCTVWIHPFSHAQDATDLPDTAAQGSSAPATLTKVAQPERTVATFGNGKSAMALLDGKTDSGYQLLPLGEECSVTLNLGNVYNVARVCVFTYDANYTFRLLTSMDGVHYTPVAENTVNVDYSAKTGYVMDIPARECCYLRLEGLTGQFGYLSLYELEVYADFSVKNPLSEVSLPYNTTATLASGSSSHTLVDGKYTGSYQMIPEGESCFVTLDLGQAYAVRTVKAFTYSGDYRFRIEGSLDGKTFLPFGENTVAEVLQQGFVLGEKVLRFAIVKVAN